MGMLVFGVRRTKSAIKAIGYPVNVLFFTRRLPCGGIGLPAGVSFVHCKNLSYSHTSFKPVKMCLQDEKTVFPLSTILSGYVHGAVGIQCFRGRQDHEKA
jgi:hypothetical protein